ncbi:nitrate reductase (plasmid) [Chelatococcus sp. CO-6]|nr:MULTISPECIES: SUMF1/EgtB/PvdO family nonheme iron enzyme [unclassified Chelatococcus]ALA20009.1 nitrate reductase [Chelatococcus sp. CO-6]
MRCALRSLLLGTALALVGLAVRADAAGIEPATPDVVRIAPGRFDYRVPGEFMRGKRPVNGPRIEMPVEQPVMIMKRQVSAAEYGRCVADGACRPAPGGAAGRGEVPVVGVTWHDASDYAAWLSEKTGRNWRLPSDEEWSFAAGSRLVDDAVSEDPGGDVANRWLARYDEESRREIVAEAEPQPFGSFGENEHGVLDIGGNVWDWTSTCFARYRLDEEGALAGKPTVNCGVRTVAGAHRGYVSDFIGDAKAGGCSVGRPPANLGIRLVLDEQSAWRRVATRLRRLVDKEDASRALVLASDRW